MHGGNLPAHYWQPPVPDDDTARARRDPGLTEPGWYFWDEAEMAVGPYPSFATAEAARKNYVP